MNYDKLLVALEQEDETLMKEYLHENVLTPCANGHVNCEVTYHIDDVLRSDTDFIKSNLLSIYNFLITPIDEMTYEVSVGARYIDTLSGIEDGKFAKTSIIMSVTGTVSPDVAEHDAIVYTNPYEVI